MNLSVRTPRLLHRSPGSLQLWLYAISLCFLPAFLFAQSDGLPRGAQLPYTRYESEDGRIGGGAALQQSPLFNQADIASEASNQKYVSLPGNGAYVEWTLGAPAQAMDLRFTMPDNTTGTGQTGSLSLYVNTVLVKTISLSSYWAYQYFTTGSDPMQTPAAKVLMRFDEVHFQLPGALKSGDVVRIQKDNGDGLTYGVDFVELEPLPASIAQPAGSLSVTSYGAVPDDNNDDFAAFNACISAAMSQGKSVYIPPGKFLLSDKLTLNVTNMKIQGAGIWYTTIYFSTPKQFYGGFYARSTGVEISDMSINTANNQRLKYNETNPRVAGDPYMIYKCFEGTYGSNSKVHDIWEEHFECGFWIAGYDPPYPVDITQNLVISSCRIRNNYADGVNFCQGTSNSTVMNCSVRNNGDDGMAVWPNNANGVSQPCINNSFHNNTVENQWRAGGTALFGGYGHQVHHNVYKDGIASSAIRATNDFSGFTFDNTQTPIHIYENTITNFGTSRDLFDQKRGAIELYANTGIFNFVWDNNNINNSQRHGVQMYGVNIYNMTFNNTVINGTGLDGTPDNPAGNEYGGFGIWSAASSQTATFNKLTVTNAKNGAYDNINSGFNLIITNATVAVSGLTINPSADTSLGSGQTLQLTAVITPADATNKNVTWRSSDSTIASVDVTGKVTARGIGTATIRVVTRDSANKSASLKVTVTPAVNVAIIRDTATEGGGTAALTIGTVGITAPITVNYTLGGTATSARYTASPALTGSVTLTPAAPAQTIVITAVNDNVFQGPQTLILTLGASAAYRLGGTTSASLLIADNDAPPCTAPVIARVNGTAPVIDQTIDASWASAPVMAIGHLTLGSVPAGYSGQWRALYDNTNLYLLVQVNDATRINDSPNWFDDDAVELFIDANNTKSSSYNGINDFQLGFRWNDNTVHVGGNSVTNTTGITFSMYATGTGYNLEAAIPWSTLGTTPAIGKPIGMDVALDDDDNGGARDGQLAAFATTTTAWTDPSVFGTVYLTSCTGGSTNQPPVANAGPDQALASGTTSATLAGTGSDPDGNTITYSWTQVSGPTATFSNVTIAAPTVSGLTNGSTYVFQLTVSDGTLTASDQVQVTVAGSTGNQPGTTTGYQLSGTLTIDGSLGESAWKINTPVTKSVIGTGNNTVTYGVLWDNTNLYVGVKVLDGSLFGNGTDYWNGDAVEVLIDANNNKSSTYDGHDNQLIQPYNNPGIFEKAGITGVQHAWAPVTGGYTVEMAIPWSQLGLTPAAGLNIGFDIANDDDDNGGGRTAQLVWNGTINDYQSTAGFGTLVLSSSTGSSATAATVAAALGKALAPDSTVFTVKLFPNPAVNGQAKALISGANGISELHISDLSGKQLLSARGQSTIDLDLRKLGRGVYIVTVINGGQRINQKLLIQ